MIERSVVVNGGGGRLGKWMRFVLVTSADIFAQCEKKLLSYKFLQRIGGLNRSGGSDLTSYGRTSVRTPILARFTGLVAVSLRANSIDQLSSCLSSDSVLLPSLQPRRILFKCIRRRGGVAKGGF